MDNGLFGVFYFCLGCKSLDKKLGMDLGFSSLLVCKG